LYVSEQTTGASFTYGDAAENPGSWSNFGVHTGVAFGSTLGFVVTYDKNTFGASAGDSDLG
jgi:hypothetical protein